MFVLAHLSDPHLGPLPRAKIAELSGKRGLGFLNWHRGRKSIHRADILDHLVHDLKAQSPDHIAVTGDLINLSLPAEFVAGRHWLNQLGAPDDVSFVPGNHDLYVRTATHAPTSHWGDYMRGDGGEGFPYLRRRGDVAIIGLSSAIPTGLLMATGALGKAQIGRLDALLEALGNEGAFRAVLVHHPLLRSRADRFKRLIDGPALLEVLRRRGAELVLHGHNHVHSVAFVDGPHAQVPVVGVPSASTMGGEADPAAYHLFRIARTADGFSCEAVTRGFRRGHDAIGEIAHRPLRPRA